MITSKSVGVGLVALAIGLAAVLVIAGTWFAGRYAGQADERLANSKKQVALLAKADRDFKAEQQRGRDAVKGMQAQLDQQALITDSLNRRLANVPRVASSPDCPRPAGAQLTRAGVVRLNTALGHPVVPAGPGGVPGAAAGADPAGGAAEPGAEWFEASGVTVDDAQRNAEVNFGRCTAIRTRCLALIDFLKTRPADTTEVAP